MERAFGVLQSQAFNDKYVDFEDSTVNFDWNKIYTSSAHHLGTARMSTSSKTGVVDKNLKVFDVDNLFICDILFFLQLEMLTVVLQLQLWHVD